MTSSPCSHPPTPPAGFRNISSRNAGSKHRKQNKTKKKKHCTLVTLAWAITMVTEDWLHSFPPAYKRAQVDTNTTLTSYSQRMEELHLHMVFSVSVWWTPGYTDTARARLLCSFLATRMAGDKSLAEKVSTFPKSSEIFSFKCSELEHKERALKRRQWMQFLSSAIHLNSKVYRRHPDQMIKNIRSHTRRIRWC